MSDPFDLSSLSSFRIGAATIHPDRLMVERDGQDIRLERKQMQLLVVLAAEPRHVFDKEELLQRVWGTTARSDAVLHKNISILRDALGDDRSAPTYIQTVQGKGYHLVAQVANLDGRLIDPLQAKTWAGRNPYVGLCAFDDAHSDVFRGRDALIKELMQAIHRQRQDSRRFVLIVGSSGCGKTSLVQAGVVPKLTAKGDNKSVQALSVTRCDFAAAQPGELLQQLAGALQAWTLGGRQVFADASAAVLADSLAEHPANVGAALDDAWLKCAPQLKHVSDDAHLLLVIDHAEALVSHSAEEGGGQERESAQRRERAQVEAVLEAICSHPRGGALVVVRGDYYAQLAEAMPALMRRKGGTGHVDVPLPQPGEITDMIRQPAQLASLRFEQDAATRACLDDVLRDAAAGQPDALPLLQHCLQALYEACSHDGLLSFAAYDAIGGLEGALAHRADTVFDDLPEHVRARLDIVLALLTRLETDTDRISAGPVLWSSLPDESARTLVETFIRARLFVAGHNDGRPDFRVAHEALLRQWPRAREWAEDNRRLLLARARLERAAARWMESGKRDDHLLNPGQPLEEAIEVAKRLPERLDGVGREFLATSNRAQRKRRRWRTGAVVALIATATVALSLAYITHAAQQEVEKQRSQAISLTTYLIEELIDEVDSTGNLHLLENIAQEVLAHCVALERDGASNAHRLACAKAYRKIADVRIEQNRLEGAWQLLQVSQALSEQVLATDASSTDAQEAAAETAAFQGKVKRLQGDYTAAGECWRRQFALTERMLSLQPENPEFMIQASYALTNLGALENDVGNHRRALALFEESARLKRDALTTTPDNTLWRYELIVTDSFISGAKERLGRLADANAEYAEQIARLKRMVLADNGKRDWERQLTSLMQFQASLLCDLGEVQAAESVSAEAIARLRSLVAAEPENRSWRRHLANAHLIASDIERFKGNRERAYAKAQGGLSVLADDQKNGASSTWTEAALQVRVALLSGATDWKTLSIRALERMRPMVESEKRSQQRRTAYIELLLLFAERLKSEGDHDMARNQIAAARRWLDTTIVSTPKVEALRIRSAGLRGEDRTTDPRKRTLAKTGYRHPDLLAYLPEKAPGN